MFGCKQKIAPIVFIQGYDRNICAKEWSPEVMCTTGGTQKQKSKARENNTQILDMRWQNNKIAEEKSEN